MLTLQNPLQAYLNDMLVDGNTLFIDNSRLESFTHCPRFGQYTILQKRIPSDEKAALTFGKHIHTALEYRYRFFGTRKLNPLELTKVMNLIDVLFALQPTPADDYRQASFAQMIMDIYLREYPEERFHIHTINDKPLIEQSFAVEIGYVGKIKVIWTGRIDLGIMWDDRLVILDHKTTSIGGEGYLSEFYTSNALKGYAFALGKVTGIPCNTAIINALICRKGSAKGTGKGPEMVRSNFISFNDDTLEEWRENVLCIVEDFLSNVQRGFFPMHTKHCSAKFGRCPMFDVCTLPPEARYAVLNSPLYSEDKWNPLHTSDVSLPEFHERPPTQIESISRFGVPTVSKPKSKVLSEADITDLIS